MQSVYQEVAGGGEGVCPCGHKLKDGIEHKNALLCGGSHTTLSILIVAITVQRMLPLRAANQIHAKRIIFAKTHEKQVRLGFLYFSDDGKIRIYAI